jgi:hypothetical protein
MTVGGSWQLSLRAISPREPKASRWGGEQILALAPLISREIVRQRRTWSAPAKQPGSRKVSDCGFAFGRYSNASNSEGRPGRETPLLG